MTRRPSPVEPSRAAIARAAAALRAGRLVAFPTETVYGLGADATSDDAVAAIYAAKRRPRFNPLIVHVADARAAARLGAWNRDAARLARAFWPGPLTIVLQRRPHAPVSWLASAGLGTLALRVPDHPVARALLRRVGRPLVAPSANRSGRVSPTRAEHVARDLGARVAAILDGGPSRVGVESTVVDLSGAHPVLLRPGGIARRDVERVLGQRLAVARAPRGDAARSSPGQLASHYAPRARLRLDAIAPRRGEAFLAFGRRPEGADPRRTLDLSSGRDLAEAAANLFAMLRALDRRSVRTIAVAPIPRGGLGDAIRDRLLRAAAPRPR